MEIQSLNWNYINAPSVDSVVYLVRPSFLSMRQIANQVHHASKLQPDIKFMLHFVPRVSYICEKILKDEGVYGALKIGGASVPRVLAGVVVAAAVSLPSWVYTEYSVDLVPIDDDILSMQQPDAFRVRMFQCVSPPPSTAFTVYCVQACYIDEDPTPLHDVARAIFKLQRLYGVIPNVRSKGPLSKVSAYVALCPVRRSSRP